MQDYDFDVVHRPGRVHSNMDASSRIRLPDSKDEERAIPRVESSINVLEGEDECGGSVTEANENALLWEPMYDLQRISKEQKQDLKIETLLDTLEQSEEEKGECSKYFVHEDVLYHKQVPPPYRPNQDVIDQVVVPRSMIRKVIELNHIPPLSGHLGYKKTLQGINQQFIWEEMAHDVKRFVASCSSCQERKTSPHLRPSPLLRFTAVKQPFELVGMDILGPLPMTVNGNKYLLLFTDYLSKWVEGVVIPDKKSETIARAFISEIIARHGVPRRLLADRGTNFLSSMIKDVYTFLDIHKLNTTPYHPATNGAIERFNRTLTQMLSHYTVDQHDWDEWLPFVLFAYRTAIHESTKETPFFLYGRDAQLPFHEIIRPSRPNYAALEDYREELVARLRQVFERTREQSEATSERRKGYFDRRAVPSELKIGDLVLLQTPAEGKGLTH